jgi:hypothetical protein
MVDFFQYRNGIQNICAIYQYVDLLHIEMCLGGNAMQLMYNLGFPCFFIRLSYPGVHLT